MPIQRLFSDLPELQERYDSRFLGGKQGGDGSSADHPPCHAGKLLGGSLPWASIVTRCFSFFREEGGVYDYIFRYLINNLLICSDCAFSCKVGALMCW